MTTLRFLVVAAVLASAPASAATIHGLVFDDADRDGKPSAGELGVAHAVVAFGTIAFAETDASGQFDITVPDDSEGIVWVRVPDGFRPGPVWAKWTGSDVDLALHRLAAPLVGPLTFVVAADSHMASKNGSSTGAELANAAMIATALDPAPAFFTILGDVTQENNDAEFDIVDQALAGLDTPWIPVPGNHDWYDGGAAWFHHYGPDNYSFDIAGVHFVVWNLELTESEILAYLGAELARVPQTMPIVALTHAPPSPGVVDTLRSLGVDYVLTGHAHSNRAVDHDGVIELNTEPFLMGGLDFTPAGYRVVTIDAGRLSSYHRTVVDAPYLSIIAPARGTCTRDTTLIVATELDAAQSTVTARVDCATPIEMHWAGGWNWRAELLYLDAGPHTVAIEATSPTGERVESERTFEVCDPGAPPAAGPPWTQLGGDATHVGARADELAPPLATRWTVTVGGQVLHAAPAIANGTVYVATTDLADGDAGGVVAIDLASGAIRWRVRTDKPLRGGPAVLGDAVIAAQIDGLVLGLDGATGTVRWRYELSTGWTPDQSAVFAAPTTDSGDVLVGHQRQLVALAANGAPEWTDDPVPDGQYSQSAAAIAIASGVAVGTFNRALGGVIAWDRATGHKLWRLETDATIAINASPVIAGDAVYIVNGMDEVLALELSSGQVRWRTKLDPAGFDWGNATIGTPAFAHGILVVPTLYRDLVALDPTTGIEIWRFSGAPSPLRTTHYRGRGEAGFAASPVITGDIVWAADTSGTLTALDLSTGAELWTTRLGAPVLASLATSGDWLVAASYDGTVRAFTKVDRERPAVAPVTCTAAPASGGCCDAGGSPSPILAVLVACYLRRRRSASSANTIGHAAAGRPVEHA